MGRTQRERNKNRKRGRGDCTDVITLQKSMGVKCRNIRVGYFEGTGRGVRCMKKLEKGDVLIALPLRHLITPKSPCNVFPLLKTHDRHPQLDLSIMLIYESHLEKDSLYFQYLATLPQSYTNLHFCTEEEMELLPMFMKKLLDSQKENIKQFFEKLKDTIQNINCPHCGTPLTKLCTRDKFLWAWFSVNTRSVYYEDEENRNKLMALAPLLDMFNHSDEAQTNMTIDYHAKQYILRTLVSYKKFSQAFIKYGCHSNLTLLLDYGFILSNNSNDLVEFTFEEILDSARRFNPQFGEMTKSKYNFIIGNKLNKNLTKNREEFSWNLNGLIRVLIAQDENLTVLQLKAYSSDYSATELSVANKVKEILVVKKLKNLESDLSEMERLTKCTESFRLAKELLKIHMNILKKI